MKTVKIEKTGTTFFLPAVDLLAVWNGTSSEETRYYLRGVLVECDGAGLRLVATDGHLLMKSELPDPAFMGGSCATQKSDHEAGFLLQTDIAEKAFKAKAMGELWIYGDVATGILQFVDMNAAAMEKGEELNRLGVCEFSRIDGTFPDWRRVLPAEADPTACACFNPDLLDRFKKARDVYTRAGAANRGSAIRINPADGNGPMRVDLAAVKRFTGVLMPVHWETAARYAA